MKLLKIASEIVAYFGGDIKFLMSTDMKTQMSINSIESSILAGEDPSVKYEGIKKLIKSEGTNITLAGGKNRYAIGKNIITYSSISIKDGVITPDIDVWTNELGSLNSEKVASLTPEERIIFEAAVILSKNSVVLSNGSIQYPEDFEIEGLRGLDVKGTYQEDGSFIIDQEEGKDILQDEYISNREFIEKVYQIIPTETTQMGYKAFPVYGFKPEAPKVKDFLNNIWEYAEVNKMICISTGKNGGIEGSSCISFQQFEKTYMEWDSYFAKKEIPKLRRA